MFTAEKRLGRLGKYFKSIEKGDTQLVSGALIEDLQLVARLRTVFLAQKILLKPFAGLSVENRKLKAIDGFLSSLGILETNGDGTSKKIYRNKSELFPLIEQLGTLFPEFLAWDKDLIEKLKKKIKGSSDSVKRG